MRPILITPEIEAMAMRYSKNIFASRDRRFEKPMQKLTALSASLNAKRGLSKNYEKYVDVVIRLLNYLNHIKPANFRRVHDKFFNGININLERKIVIGGVKKAFHKHLTEAMRYEAVRNQEFLPYVRELGIRACVYCNASYALSIVHRGDAYGKFELDHHWPQSKFPYLCTNFYNLTPCCSNCNKYKLDRESEFSLYTADPNGLDQFDFALEKRSVIKYMLSQDANILEIKFSARNHGYHEDLFKIQATYDVLKDAVEEIIWKSKIYNGSYLKSLSNSFERKFLPGNFHRFLLGNYDRPQDIHKRPLSKMTQDIARQLGIIE